MELKCAVQNYEWGKLGLESKVAKLFKIANPEFEVDEDTPYAELWMGTHINGPSENKNTGEPLSTIISHNPQFLGEPIRQRFGDELPFLFKVLAVNKALSIQAHPAKEHAEMLHASLPDIYKDPNHKPELAIALTPFAALCGFRPLAEIQGFMQEVRELRALVGTKAAEDFITSGSNASKDMLKACFKNLMSCSESIVTEQLKQLIMKFSFLDEEKRKLQLAPLIERLYSEFPDDIGCFVAYFLNFVSLQPFEALYLGPNEPHAYLSGDCVECMACSDNVVRAGLTPKYKDVETLCNMLTYECRPAEAQLFKPIVENKYSQIFKPPVPDFAVIKIEIPTGTDFVRLLSRNSASILLTIAGSGYFNDVLLRPGVVFFIPANEKVEVKNVTQHLLLFQAIANV